MCLIQRALPFFTSVRMRGPKMVPSPPHCEQGPPGLRFSEQEVGRGSFTQKPGRKPQSCTLGSQQQVLLWTGVAVPPPSPGPHLTFHHHLRAVTQGRNALLPCLLAAVRPLRLWLGLGSQVRLVQIFSRLWKLLVPLGIMGKRLFGFEVRNLN